MYILPSDLSVQSTSSWLVRADDHPEEEVRQCFVPRVHDPQHEETEEKWSWHHTKVRKPTKYPGGSRSTIVNSRPTSRTPKGDIRGLTSVRDQRFGWPPTSSWIHKELVRMLASQINRASDSWSASVVRCISLLQIDPVSISDPFSRIENFIRHSIEVFINVNETLSSSNTAWNNLTSLFESLSVSWGSHRIYNCSILPVVTCQNASTLPSWSNIIIKSLAITKTNWVDSILWKVWCPFLGSSSSSVVLWSLADISRDSDVRVRPRSLFFR